MRIEKKKNTEKNKERHLRLGRCCRIALWAWDGFKDAAPFCIGFHEVAEENGSKFVCQNSP